MQHCFFNGIRQPADLFLFTDIFKFDGNGVIVTEFKEVVINAYMVYEDPDKTMKLSVDSLTEEELNKLIQLIKSKL